MSGLSESGSLAALIADVRAALEAALSVGARFEPTGLALPAVPAAPEEEQDDLVVPVAPDMAPVVAPSTANAWAALAEQERASASPTWAEPGAQDGLGAAGLTRIREDLGDCRRCRLCEGRKNIVFGVGEPEADLMVIGEGPGEQEDLKGEPFVGPAGQMLDRMLANVIGLTRDRVYIANIVKCRPPDNRKPAPEEAAACQPFLERQIRAVQPKVLLVLGGVAASNLLGIEGITRNRGREVSWRGLPAILSFHPAYLLRVPGDKRLAMEDLLKVKARYDALGGRRP